MRVLHVIPGLGVGGAESMLIKLLGPLREVGVGGYVCSLLPGGALVTAAEGAGFAVSDVDLKGAPVAGLARLRREVSRIAPDVIQTWMYHANVLGFLATLRLGVPVVWNVRHSLSDIRLEKRSLRAVIRLERALSGFPDHVVFNSLRARDQHLGFGYKTCEKRLSVIPNGFDTTRFRPDANRRVTVRRRLGFRQDERVVGMVARNHPMKDYRTFLRMAKVLKERTPNVRFLMVGKGVPDLAREVAEAGIGDAVRLLDAEADIAPLYNAMDVFCLSSAWGEGFPNVLGEALASGVPAVATDVGDSGAILEGVGYAVPARASEAMASALRELLLESDARKDARAIACRRRIEERYGLQAVAGAYRDVYRRFCSASAR